MFRFTMTAAVLLGMAANARAEQTEITYSKHVAPVLRKYCGACHNADDREGGLSLASYADMLKGGENGAVITPKRSDLSRLVRVVTGESKPKMPPDDEPGPSQDELARLKAWIDDGARGPSGGEPDPTILVTPKIEPRAKVPPPVTSVAVAPGGKLLAVARGSSVELRQAGGERKLVAALGGHRGQVNRVDFSRDGRFVVAAAGEPGLFGEARIWSVADRKLVRSIQGHRDSLYVARFNPAGKVLATAGYDQKIMLWRVTDGKLLCTLSGHNDAVYDLAFRPAGEILASASGDRTVKLWDVATGRRLDTLSQATKELYALAFSLDGRRLVAAGVDNRIRLWRISDSGREGTNRLLKSKFAHDAPILALAISDDGRRLASSAENRTIKLWDFPRLRLRRKLPLQPGWAGSLAFLSGGRQLAVGRLDGSLAVLSAGGAAKRATPLAPLPETPPVIDYGPQPPAEKLPLVHEKEPNDTPSTAGKLAAPGRAAGVIAPTDSGAKANAAEPAPRAPDVDLYRFSAKQGEQWIIETLAARRKSSLDSKIEVLDAAGQLLERLKLRAIRDSELEFRGMDSNQRGARLLHWEEMKLNQYIYLSGEVVKLYQDRRGPDSDSQFYPESGSRLTYFDTSPRSHALGEPAYVVVPYPAESDLPDNGLPVFPLYFENDDAPRLGKDSRLTFIAPRDGEYLIRVSDVRGLAGPNHKYELVVRRPQPDFRVSLSAKNLSLPAGGGARFSVKAERIDNFNGDITVEISGLPAGYQVNSPLVIPAGLYEAKGVIYAAREAAAPPKGHAAKIKVAATAQIAGRTVSHKIAGLGPLKLAPKPQLLVELAPNESSGAASAGQPAEVSAKPAAGDRPTLTIAPGETITCRLKIIRQGFAGRVQFDVENLPHGVIVDNIGLNGVLIPEGQTERTLFLTAYDWVRPTEREFFAVGKAAGKPASPPLRIRVAPAAAR